MSTCKLKKLSFNFENFLDLSCDFRFTVYLHYTSNDNRSIVIKKADKGSCVVVLDSWDYVKQVEKQLGDSTAYEELNYSKKILSQLVDSSNKYFKKLNSNG